MNKEYIQEIIDSSTSLLDVIRKIGWNDKGSSSYHRLYNVCYENGIDLSEIKLKSHRIRTKKLIHEKFH